MFQDDFEEAVKCYRSALAAKPGHARSLLNFQVMLDSLGESSAGVQLGKQVRARA